MEISVVGEFLYLDGKLYGNFSGGVPAELGTWRSSDPLVFPLFSPKIVKNVNLLNEFPYPPRSIGGRYGNSLSKLTFLTILS